MKNLVCPISDQRINEHITRFNAMFAIGTIILAFTLNSVILLAFLMVDFFIRAFTELKFSPISYISHSLTHTLRLPIKLIDKAPKTFAARLGFILITVISGLFVFDLHLASILISGILIVFASLEFLFSFCIGCKFYTYLILPFYKK